MLNPSSSLETAEQFARTKAKIAIDVVTTMLGGGGASSSLD